MLDNVILALETAMTHDDMTAIVEANLEGYKEENAWGFCEAEVKAMTTLTVAFFMQHHMGENPYLMFSTLKDSQYEFKGAYEPLNNVTADEYLHFLNGTFEIIDLEAEETEEEAVIEESFKAETSVALWYNDEFTYMYVDEVLEDGKLRLFSRKHGEVITTTGGLRNVECGSLEDIVAQAEYFHAKGETIYLYDGECKNLLLSFIPVEVDGKLHILNKANYAIDGKGYESLIHLMKDVVESVEGIKVIEVL